MGTADFQVLFKALAELQLSVDEVACLQNFCTSAAQPGHCFTLIDEAAGKRICPHCAGNRCHRCGQANGLQRYRCLGCGRSFNALTGTPLARLRLREKWLPYLQCLIGSDTVRTAARRVAVAKSTSFRWRHRFLAAMRRAPLPRLSGIVEATKKECSLAGEHRYAGDEPCSSKPLLRLTTSHRKRVRATWIARPASAAARRRSEVSAGSSIASW